MDEVDDGVDEPRRVAHEDAGPGLAKFLGDGVVVRTVGTPSPMYSADFAAWMPSSRSRG